MKEKWLLKLAEHLEKRVPDPEFDMCEVHMDALFHATRIVEFKKHGLKFDQQTMYRNKSYLDAASAFFDITLMQTQYLFSGYEFDELGHMHHSMHSEPTDRNEFERRHEPPRFTAVRIRAFVRDQSKKSTRSGKVEALA